MAIRAVRPMRRRSCMHRAANRLPALGRGPPVRCQLMVSARAFRLPASLAAIAVVAAIAGCASAPSGGVPRRATGTGSQVQSYVQPLPPPPPTKSWTAAAVVLGFLHASASYAFDPAAAEQYLAPQLRKTWQRRTRGPVAVVGTPTSAREPYNKPQGPAGAPVEIVKLSGQLLD